MWKNKPAAKADGAYIGRIRASVSYGHTNLRPHYDPPVQIQWHDTSELCRIYLGAPEGPAYTMPFAQSQLKNLYMIRTTTPHTIYWRLLVYT